MIKSAIPATILLAAFQSKTWSNHFNVLNYLVAIEGLLAVCILPRAKFLQTLFLNVLLVCLAIAINLLALWSAIQARKHTAKQGDGEYNSSQSAVCAIWFMVQIYLTNALRSSRPQFQFPCVNYCIVAIISAVQAGPSFMSTHEMVDFMWLQLQAFLTGFAVAAGVSLFILPHSNRDIALASMKEYIRSIKRALEAYQNTPETRDTSNACARLKVELAALNRAHARLGSDLEFAVRDFGFSHLSAGDFASCYQHLRGVYLPMLSLAILLKANIFNGHAEDGNCHSTEGAGNLKLFEATSHKAAQEIGDSLELMSRLVTKPTTASLQNDPEKDNSIVGVITSHVQQLQQLTEELKNQPWHHKHNGNDEVDVHCCGLHCQPMEVERYTLWHSSKATVSMLEFARSRVESGAWCKRKLVLPSRETLLEWGRAMFARPESATRSIIFDPSIDDAHRDALNAALFGRDPQHLPPATMAEQFGEYLRIIPRLLKSPHSLFGLRAMCASISLAIVSYLRTSHNFFVEQRCLWAVVMTAIAMNNSAGQVTYNFMLRILASVIGTIGSLIAWYIVDGHTAGVIFFTFVHMALSFYWCVVKPKYALLAIVSAVTPIISVGYVLNVDILPRELLEETETPKYPIYQIAAYRLVNVIAGLAAAYFWSIFPFPVTEAYVMRQKLGSCAYLLARYNAIMSETTLVDAPPNIAETLQEVRLDVLHQAQSRIVKLKTSSSFTRWQVEVGGRLPVQDYQTAIELLDSLTTNMAVMAYSTMRTTSPHLSELVGPSHMVTSLLCLIAASFAKGQLLPPYLPLTATDDDKSESPELRKWEDPALAVAKMAAIIVRKDTVQLTEVIKRLCGTLDLRTAVEFEPTLILAATTSRA